MILFRKDRQAIPPQGERMSAFRQADAARQEARGNESSLRRSARRRKYLGLVTLGRSFWGRRISMSWHRFQRHGAGRRATDAYAGQADHINA
jgi:hypothetical protein